MRGKYRPHRILEVVLLFIALAGFSASDSKANENSKYLDAVREFADNVLKYGRDTYGPKHTPLFVDGLNIHTHEPVKWIDPDGTKWILSNFASQQTLMRTLDGLSNITGDAKYRQAAMDTIKCAFDHLRTPNGLLYWGHITAYDALGDTVRGNKSRQSWKLHYPYYDLMWKVDPDATRKLIESLWSAHILDWSNLDFDRHGSLNSRLEEPWNHEYKGGPTFFKSKSRWALANSVTGSSLVQAGTTLYRLSREEQPLIWSKRLAKRFVDTRHPKTGISALMYNHPWLQLGEDMKEHFVDPYTTIFPWDFYEFRYLYYPESAQAHPWMSIFLAGDLLGEEGKEFTQWALEELTAWGKVSYRKRDNSFVPMLTDGTYLEGYVWEKGPGCSSGVNVIKPYPADPSFFWAYSVAYSTTGDEFMWQMVRDIALGNKLGDIGETSAHTPKVQMETACSHAYGIFGFLELYKKTKTRAFLNMARRIGDNILLNQFYKGFFVPSKKHIYTRFDCFEPVSLLHLHAAMNSTTKSVPQVCPSIPLFVPPYRHKQEGEDRRVIYALTESPEPPISLQEAAAIGDVNMVRSLLENGTDVDSLDDGFLKTALHRAAIRGHKDVAQLLLAEGAGVDARDWGSRTPLHYAAERGHKEIVELLIAKGVDVNAKNNDGQTPTDLAITQNQKEIVDLLVEKGADVSLHTAARRGHKEIVELLLAKGADVSAKNNEGRIASEIAMSSLRPQIAKLLANNGADISSIHLAASVGNLAKVKAFLQRGIDINAQDSDGRTPLHYAATADVAEFLISNGADIHAGDKEGETPLHTAAGGGCKDVVELLITKGADVDAKKSGYTPLSWAIWRDHEDVIRSLVTHGADVNFVAKDDWPFLHYVVWNDDKDLVEFFVTRGAKLDVKDNGGWTALHYAANQGYKEIVEYLVSKGADVNAKENKGQTTLQLAKDKGHTEIVELLRKHGAKEDILPESAPKEEKPSDPNTVSQNYVHPHIMAGDGTQKRLFSPNKTIFSLLFV